MLHEFITAHRDEIIVRCETKVKARADSPPITLPRYSGVPVFLDQLVDELRQGTTDGGMCNSGSRHGHDLLSRGFTLSEVVHDYGDICQAITGLAVELDAPMRTDDFRLLNQCLDDAIAGAITQYGRERDRSIDDEAAGATERLRTLARDLRSSIHTASVAFAVIKAGRVGGAGSTGTVLEQSLVGAFDLVDRLLAELPGARLLHSQITTLPGHVTGGT
jgi:hypothetical protein